VRPERLALAAALALGCARGGAFADPPAVDAVAAQHGFAVGDLALRKGEPVEALDPVAEAIAWVRDGCWRPPSDAPAPRLDVELDPIRARAAWLVRVVAAARTGGAEPEESAAAPDPLPILSALVLDRIRRERHGLHSTRDEGPLAAVAAEEPVGWFLDQWVPGAYGGPGAIPSQDAEADRRHARELRDTAARNAWIAAAAIAGLLGLAAVGGGVAGRRRGGATEAISRAPAEVASPPSPSPPSAPPTRSAE